MIRHYFLFIFLAFLNAEAQSQKKSFRGLMVYPGGGPMPYGYVAFPISKDTIEIDSTGRVNIDLKDPKNRVFFVSNGDIKGKVFRFEDGYAPDSLHLIPIPDTSFYRIYQKKGVCPICRLTKSVVPIVYGLPDQTLFRSAKKGKIVLAGCIIPEYPLKFYCKRDAFDF